MLQSELRIHDILFAGTKMHVRFYVLNESVVCKMEKT